MRTVDQQAIAAASLERFRSEYHYARWEYLRSAKVIEAVEHPPADARAYLAECHRVLRPGGILYLSTAPFQSLAGAHLPRLLVPVPLHLLLGRRLAFRAFCALARHAPWTLRERKEANTFIALAAEGKQKEDDLHQRVTLRLLTEWIREAGFRVVREERHTTGFFRALPGGLRRFLERTPFAQDVMTGHVQCVLERA